MAETPLFFPSDSRSLFGVLHEPAEATGTPFVFCHPFAEEKLWSHRVHVAFARRLAQRGHAVLRFDFSGLGDSEGDCRHASLATMRADVRSALAEIRRRRRVQRVGLLGLRLGATVASLAAEDDPEIDRVVLWAPITDGAKYMQELLRTNLATQLAVYREVRRDREALVEAMRKGDSVNVDGYDIAWPMFDEVSAVRLAQRKHCQAPCLIVKIERQSSRPAPDLEALAAAYSTATICVAQEEPFWREIAAFYDDAPALFTETLQWLEEGTPGAPGDAR